MEKQEKKLGSGFIEKACEAIGVKRGVYYNAKRNLDQGKPLSANQIAVMEKYQALTRKAEASLEAIRG